VERRSTSPSPTCSAAPAVSQDTLRSAEYERRARKHPAARDLLGDDDPLSVARDRLLADLVR
jgi:hypothetical protein